MSLGTIDAQKGGGLARCRDGFLSRWNDINVRCKAIIHVHLWCRRSVRGDNPKTDGSHVLHFDGALALFRHPRLSHPSLLDLSFRLFLALLQPSACRNAPAVQIGELWDLAPSHNTKSRSRNTKSLHGVLTGSRSVGTQCQLRRNGFRQFLSFLVDLMFLVSAIGLAFCRPMKPNALPHRLV